MYRINQKLKQISICHHLSPGLTCTNRHKPFSIYIFSSQSNYNHTLIAKVTFKKKKKKPPQKLKYSVLILSMQALPSMFLEVFLLRPFYQVNNCTSKYRCPSITSSQIPDMSMVKHDARMIQADRVSYTQSKNHIVATVVFFMLNYLTRIRYILD